MHFAINLLAAASFISFEYEHFPEEKIRWSTNTCKEFQLNFTPNCKVDQISAPYLAAKYRPEVVFFAHAQI